jgi:hypothetical protein
MLSFHLMGFGGLWLGVVLAAAPGAASGAESAAVSPAVTSTAAAVAPAAAKPADAGADAATAQKRMRAITDGVGRIRRLMPLADNRAVRATCVMQNLVEAKIHVQLADQEMALLAGPAPDAGKAEDTKAAPATPEPARPAAGADAEARAHALMRLDLIAKRTVELERAARVCVDDEESSIDVIQVQVEEMGKPAAKNKK